MNLSQKIEKTVKKPINDKLLVGDEVIIIAGRSKKQKGILAKKIRTREGLRYVVSGCHLVLKNTKPNPRAGVSGGQERIEASIHSSNVAIFNPKTEKADKVMYAMVDGEKRRCFKSTGEEIPHRSSKKTKE